MFEKPTRREWDEAIAFVKGNYPLHDTYEEFLAWIEHANAAIDAWIQIAREWNAYCDAQRKEQASFRYNLLNPEPHGLLWKAQMIIRQIPDLHFGWRHALTVTSRKQRVKQYERATRELRAILDTLQGKNKKPERANLQKKSVYVLLCPSCNEPLGSTTPYGFILKGQWHAVPAKLRCSSCRKTFLKPRNPWKHGIQNTQ